MSSSRDFEVIEAADVETLSFDERADAFYRGTTSIHALMENVVSPVVQGQIGKSGHEQAVAVTFYRIELLLRGLKLLVDPAHFQIVISVARTVFELVLDLKVLAADHATAQKLHAFARVAKFRKASQLKAFLDANPSVDQSSHQEAISCASDSAREQEVERDCIRHWGADRNGNPRWPDHWSGLNIADRAGNAGIEFAEMYRSQFFLQSYYVHAGPAGIQSLSREALICTFGIAHRLVQQLAATAVEVVADEFYLFSTELDLRDKLRRASAASGFFAVQAVLQKQAVDAVNDTEDEE